jgi:hypothetical protein
MKNLVVILLAVILVITLTSLLSNLGILSGVAGGGPEYKVVNGEEIDRIGFRSVATEEGIPISEAGEINFPKEMAEKLTKAALLPRTFKEIAKDGGWQFKGVTSDDLYIFSR